MKTKCSLLVSLVALVIVVAGCGTTGSHSGELISPLPPNTVVIQNHSSYHLDVLRNGTPWRQSRYWNGNIVSPQTSVSPGEIMTFHNVTTNGFDRITVGITATKVTLRGCVVSEKTMWQRNWVLEVGTNSSPKRIVVHGWHF